MADRNWFGTKGSQINVGTNETLLVKGLTTNTLSQEIKLLAFVFSRCIRFASLALIQLPFLVIDDIKYVFREESSLFAFLGSSRKCVFFTDISGYQCMIII